MSNDLDKNKKVPNVPNLRFPDFGGEWVSKPLKKLCLVNPKNSYDVPESFLYIDLESVKQGILFKKEIIVKETAPSRAQRCLIINDILYSCVRPYQHNNYIFKMNEKVVASTGFAVLRGQPSSTFLYSLIDSKNFESKVMNRCTGTSYPAINSSNLASIVINVPSKEEQIKIGDFLDIINTRIECQNKIIEDLKSSVKAILDVFFEHTPNSKIGNYITEISERNKNDFDYPVFSVSNKKGFIPQQEQFEDKVIASDDKCSYKIVSKNTFAYNPARINVGSIGLYELDSPCIVSPMYNCFGVKEIDPMYLLMYFKSSFFINEMSKRLEGSVRMCLTMCGLKNLPIYIPPMNEMNKLINVYLVINRKLQNSTKLLNLYLKQKDYLLSNLFI